MAFEVGSAKPTRLGPREVHRHGRTSIVTCPPGLSWPDMSPPGKPWALAVCPGSGQSSDQAQADCGFPAGPRGSRLWRRSQARWMMWPKCCPSSALASEGGGGGERCWLVGWGHGQRVFLLLFPSPQSPLPWGVFPGRPGQLRGGGGVSGMPPWCECEAGGLGAGVAEGLPRGVSLWPAGSRAVLESHTLLPF